MAQSKRFPWLWLAIPVVALGGAFLLPKPQGHAVARISGEDKELQAAVTRARAELPSFIKALQHPKAGDEFAVKGAFKTDQGPEYLWVKAPVYVEGGFIGVLDQRPMLYKGSKEGDTVDVAKDDVYDWLIVHDRKIVAGGFTDEVLTRR